MTSTLVAQEDRRNSADTPISLGARDSPAKQWNRSSSACIGSDAKISRRYAAVVWKIFRETSARHARAHRINSSRADRLAPPTCHGELTDFKSSRFGREPKTTGFLRGRETTVRFPRQGWFRLPGQPPEKEFLTKSSSIFSFFCFLFSFFLPFFLPHPSQNISQRRATHTPGPPFFFSSLARTESLPRISTDYKSSLSSYLGNLHESGFPAAFVACPSPPPRGTCNAKRQTRLLRTGNPLVRGSSHAGQARLCVRIYTHYLFGQLVGNITDEIALAGIFQWSLNAESALGLI